MFDQKLHDSSTKENLIVWYDQIKNTTIVNLFYCSYKLFCDP